MTPGQIITAGQVVAALVVALVAQHRGRNAAAWSAVALIAALIATRATKAIVPPDVAFASWAVMWVTVGGWIARLGMQARDRPVVLAGGLSIGAALFDAASWLTAARPVLWSPPVMLADCLVVAAIAACAWRSWHGGHSQLVSRPRVQPDAGGFRGLARDAPAGADRGLVAAARRGAK